MTLQYVPKCFYIKSKNTKYRASCKHENGKLFLCKYFWSLTGDERVWVIHYREEPSPVRKLSALFGKFRYASDGTVLYFTWYGTVLTYSHSRDKDRSIHLVPNELLPVVTSSRHTLLWHNSYHCCYFLTFLVILTYLNSCRAVEQ